MKVACLWRAIQCHPLPSLSRRRSRDCRRIKGQLILTELIKITHKSPEQTLSVELPPQKEYGATTRQMQHIEVFREPNAALGLLACIVACWSWCAVQQDCDRSLTDRRHAALCRNKM